MNSSSIIRNFRIEGEPISCERYGNGHINETYKCVTSSGKEYILQRINTNIFKEPEKLMENISSVCNHIASKSNDSRGTMTIITTHDFKNCFIDENNCYWRVYDFIKGSLCLEKVTQISDFYESAVGFGTFQKMLSDFPAETLHETIKDFHNTPDRYRIFKEAIKKNPLGRVKEVEKEIEFALEREEAMSVLKKMLDKNELPLRVTHNDTKLNNVLLDAKTRKALCVIDLDTVMPGLASYDFGDSIRFGATSAPEDEKDLSKVNFIPELFETYANGFLSACGKALTKSEVETMPEGAKIMTMECGVRFLTDYIVGDTYFRTSYPGQNLDRTRTQFKLVSDMETKFDYMKKTVMSFN